MQAGKLRDPIVIQSPVVARSDYGEPSKSWSDFASVRAEVEKLSGTELVSAQQVQPTAKYRVRIRYYPGVVETMRVIWQERTLGILDVDNVKGRNREMILLCGEEP